MEFLGIGPSELFFIVLIALIVLGPRDMQKAGRTIGRWLRRVVTSDGWKLFQQTSREFQTLPNRLMREAALDELKEMQKEVRQPLEGLRQDLGRPIEINQAIPPPDPSPEPDAPSAAPENRILPPASPPPAALPDDDKDPNA
jgi:sec-independent protein translocase protein TatB